MADVSLVVRRRIAAPPQRVFDAWTQPRHLEAWWGPGGVTCPEAHVDLRVGGALRIANDTPGGLVWIQGHFEVVEPPHRLVYTWQMEGHAGPPSRVTVRFDPAEGGTEVTVVHTRIDSEPTRDSHELGWHGCLDGLEQFLAG